jgi:hypothetical protein
MRLEDLAPQVIQRQPITASIAIGIGMLKHQRRGTIVANGNRQLTA